MIIAFLLFSGLLLGGGLATPFLVRAAANRTEAREQARREAEDAAERRREEARLAEQAEQQAADAERQRELDEIADDPQRHLWRTMVAAFEQRVLSRQHEREGADQEVVRATEALASARTDLDRHDASHLWMANARTRMMVQAGVALGVVLLPLAFVLDWMITTAVYPDVFGWLLAPLAIVLVGLGAQLGSWALALGDRSARAMGTPARGLGAAAALILVVGTTAILMTWAPARPSKVYDPQIQDQSVVVDRLVQRKASASEIARAQDVVRRLQDDESRWVKVDQGLVGLQVLAEALVVEALALSGALRRRRSLAQAVEQGEEGVEEAGDVVAAVVTRQKQDAAHVVGRMADDLTRAGFGYERCRVLIGNALAASVDVHLFRRLLAGVEAEGTETANTEDGADAPGTRDAPWAHRPPAGSQTQTEVVAGTVLAEPPVRRTAGLARPRSAGTVAPGVEEIPMPAAPAPAPLLDLDHLDEAL